MILTLLIFIAFQDKMPLELPEATYRYQELQKLEALCYEHPETVIAYVEPRLDSWEREHPAIYADLVIGASNALLSVHRETYNRREVKYHLLNRQWILDALNVTSVWLDPLDRHKLFLRLQTHPFENPLLVEQRHEDAQYIVQTLRLMIEHHEWILNEEAKKPYQFFKPIPDKLDAKTRMGMEKTQKVDVEEWNRSAVRSNWKTDFKAARNDLMNNMIRLYSYDPLNLEELKAILADSSFDDDEQQIIVNKVTYVHVNKR